MSQATIATEHYGIRVASHQRHVALIYVPTCRRCKHAICPGCGDWCDRLIGQGLDQCCGGKCVPTAARTTYVRVEASDSELILKWHRLAAELIEKLEHPIDEGAP